MKWVKTHLKWKYFCTTLEKYSLVLISQKPFWIKTCIVQPMLHVTYRITSQPRGFLLCAYLLYLSLQSALIEVIITNGKVLVLSLQQGSRLLFSMTFLCSSIWAKKIIFFTSEVIQIDGISLPALNPWTPAWSTTAFCQFSVSLLQCY